MGVWGAGNLDSDGALDEVGMQSDRLAKRIWNRLRRRASWEADEYDHDALFVDLEVALALHAAGLFSTYGMPKPEDLDKAYTKWLAGWDVYFDGLDPKGGFKAERRAVIEQTFARFRALAVRTD